MYNDSYINKYLFIFLIILFGTIPYFNSVVAQTTDAKENKKITPKFISQKQKYYNTKDPEDLMKWEEAIMDSIQTNPAVEFKKRKSFPIPPIVRGEHQLRFSISPTETDQVYRIELEATDDQVPINDILLIGNGSIIRIRGTVPFPFESKSSASSESSALKITGFAVRTEGPGISNSMLKTLRPVGDIVMYVVHGDKDDPLTFLAVTGTGENDGVIYMHGKGSVKKPDGTIYYFGDINEKVNLSLIKDNTIKNSDNSKNPKSVHLTEQNEEYEITEYEITEYPKIIYNDEISIHDLRLLGVKIGDSEKNIPSGLIVERTSANWIRCRGGAGYHVENRIVDKFRLDEDILHKLKILNKDDIITHLGKPDAIKDLIYPGLYEEFVYSNKGISVIWHLKKDNLSGIIIGP